MKSFPLPNGAARSRSTKVRRSGCKLYYVLDYDKVGPVGAGRSHLNLMASDAKLIDGYCYYYYVSARDSFQWKPQNIPGRKKEKDLLPKLAC